MSAYKCCNNMYVYTILVPSKRYFDAFSKHISNHCYTFFSFIMGNTFQTDRACCSYVQVNRKVTVN